MIDYTRGSSSLAVSNRFAISECPYTACLSHPCLNGGICRGLEEEILKGIFQSFKSKEFSHYDRFHTGSLSLVVSKRFAIFECPYTACLSRPCLNGGICRGLEEEILKGRFQGFESKEFSHYD